MPQTSSDLIRNSLEPAIIAAWNPTKIHQGIDLDGELPQGQLDYAVYIDGGSSQDWEGPLATVRAPQINYEMWIVGCFKKAEADVPQQVYRNQKLNDLIQQIEALGSVLAGEFNFPLAVEAQIDNELQAGEGAFTVAVKFTCSHAKEFGS